VIQLSPNTAFSSSIFGLLLIYTELCAPGLVVPGSVGAVLLLGGTASLIQKGPTVIGGVLLSVGLAFVCAAIYRKPVKVLLVVSIAFLTVGAKLLIPKPGAISLVVALPLIAVAAGTTVVLSRLALLAKRTKRSDPVLTQLHKTMKSHAD
jgi:membrane-bound ClpP family serine protease